MKGKSPQTGILTPLNKEDELLWRTVTSDVRPLASSRALTQPPSPAAVPTNIASPRFRNQDNTASPITLNFTTQRALPELDHGHAPGVDKQNKKRLIRGRKVIEARLDLHGQTQEDARANLISFIQRAYNGKRRCVLVITGKGLRLHSGEIGVLRRNVPRWLNESPLRPLVLAFSHATPKDGGEGALYVLLKRNK